MKKQLNISQEEFERIERYHLGTLSAEANGQFEKEMRTNPTFAEKVVEVSNLIQGVEYATLKNTLDQYHEEIDTSTHNSIPNRNKTRTPLIAIAAVLIVLLGIFWFLNDDSATDTLFAKHFTPDPGLPTTMSETRNFKFYDGMVNYKQEDYETALQKWNLLVEEYPENDTLQYFIGVAYLAHGNEQNAITKLENLYNSNTESFKNETAYYLGLAFLKSENLKKAKKYLTFSDTKRAREVLLDID
jgi:TolA-binding protein